MRCFLAVQSRGPFLSTKAVGKSSVHCLPCCVDPFGRPRWSELQSGSGPRVNPTNVRSVCLLTSSLHMYQAKRKTWMRYPRHYSMYSFSLTAMVERFMHAQVQFLASSRDFVPQWEKPFEIATDTMKAIDWCAARSSSEAMRERELSMTRIRKLAARLRETGTVTYSPDSVFYSLLYMFQVRSANGSERRRTTRYGRCRPLSMARCRKPWQQ